MSGISDLPKGYCRAFGKEALFATTASYCREANGCTAPDCPLETSGQRPDTDRAVNMLGGGLALTYLVHAGRRER
ncbi:MAG: hypothetical protein R3D57_14880 [Hyphomicrobiaceae bacterium]